MVLFGLFVRLVYVKRREEMNVGRLNLFGVVNGAIKTEVGYPQLIADFDTAEPYDWGD